MAADEPNVFEIPKIIPLKGPEISYYCLILNLDYIVFN